MPGVDVGLGEGPLAGRHVPSQAPISWWGKIRSLPPPETSKPGPRLFSAMVVHSMCQPACRGRRARGQDGSPGRSARQSSQSSEVALAGPVGVAAALAEQRQHGLLVVAGDRAELGGGGAGEVDVAVDAVRRLAQPLDQRGHLVDDLGDADVLGRGRMRSAAMSVR